MILWFLAIFFPLAIVLLFAIIDSFYVVQQIYECDIEYEGSIVHIPRCAVVINLYDRDSCEINGVPVDFILMKYYDDWSECNVV